MTTADVLTEIKVSLATLNGKVDTMASQMEAGDRQSAQLVALVRDQLSYLAADTGVLKAQVSENEVKANEATSAVRVDLERQIKELRTDLNRAIEALTSSVNDLNKWRARVAGIAVGAAGLSSIATAVVLKAVGA